MRIDHVMGLNRLWVIPPGAPGSAGAYLQFPETDFLRLIALESHRHRAIILGEDLGTVPYGYGDRLRNAGILGLRVLAFERGFTGFTPPADWTRQATAMTSTHDLPTVAGWWQGGDIAWRERLGLLGDPTAERLARATDRALLWQALASTGAAEGPMPVAEAAADVVDAACRHVGGSACDLVILPAEDALALTESPNIPGTIDEHPNWRRRLPEAGLDAPGVAERLAGLAAAR